MFYLDFSRNEKLGTLTLLRFSFLVYWSSDEIQSAADDNMDEATKLVTKNSNWVSRFAVKATSAAHAAYSDVVTSVVSKANQLRDRRMFHQHLLSTRVARDAAANSTGQFALTRGASVMASYLENHARIMQANL